MVDFLDRMDRIYRIGGIRDFLERKGTTEAD